MCCALFIVFVFLWYDTHRRRWFQWLSRWLRWWLCIYISDEDEMARWGNIRQFVCSILVSVWVRVCIQRNFVSASLIIAMATAKKKKKYIKWIQKYIQRRGKLYTSILYIKSYCNGARSFFKPFSYYNWPCIHIRVYLCECIQFTIVQNMIGVVLFWTHILYIWIVIVVVPK